ncbi:RICIN domain-containing protein [Halocatena marina]|uniref:RICIN domain-containing protein n=1 Tax=Halocatena marina TaxID=2934937 RepID=UPI003623C956
MSDTNQRDTHPVTRRTAIKSIAGVAGIGVGTLTLSGRASAVGEYLIRHMDSWKVLDATGDNHGANVVLWDYWGGDNQRWYLTFSGDERRFKNVDNGLVLGVKGSNIQNGANVTVRNPGIGPEQSWFSSPLSGGGIVSRTGTQQSDAN